MLELVLFSLTQEDGLLDWEWIDARRDSSLTASQALRKAPQAWKRWVKDGSAAFESSRRRVYPRAIQTPAEQARTTQPIRAIIEQVYRYFTKKSNAYAFEGLASLIASRVLGPSSSRGWVTPRVDRGIDFVNRLDLGSGFSRTAVVVLGQAKRIKPDSSVSGIDLARTAARPKRGWIGVVVTTGTFSARAQGEVLEDQYPLVLINGQGLAQELQLEMTETGLSLEQLLDREVAWYDANMRILSPERIAFGDHWGAQV